MYNVHLAGGLDVAELVVYAFFLFFLGLVIYLRREDRREGYPLEDDLTGRLQSMGGLLETPAPKTFRIGEGQPDVVHPTFVRDSAELQADRTEGFSGSPLTPRGDPLTSAVGPASWVNRLDVPDTDFEGHRKIVPMSIAGHGFHIHPRDPNPIGMTVIGADGAVAGTVTEVWVDVPERMIRFLEVDVPGLAHPAAATAAGTAAPATATAVPAGPDVDARDLAMGDRVPTDTGSDGDAMVRAAIDTPPPAAAPPAGEGMADPVDGPSAPMAGSAPIADADPAPTPASGTLDTPNPAPEPAAAAALAGVLVPMPMCNVDRRSNTVYVGAITAAQFAGIPGPANPQAITRREEERIFGYIGGGYLYATPERAEPFA